MTAFQLTMVVVGVSFTSVAIVAIILLAVAKALGRI